MSSEPPDTRCARCGRTYPASVSEPHRCECGGPLELVGARQPPAVDRGPITSVAAVAASLPIEQPVDLGAGGTPEIDLDGFDASAKLEFCNPTGSFKDRGAALTIARAVGLDAERVKEDSSGNAGLATAAHAARAGLEATIYVPAHAAGATLEGIRSTGARVVPIEGTRDDVATACVTADDGWYASHAWRPEFYAGTATLAWELVADRDGRAPDAVVLPVGHGTLLLGVYRGFRQLADAGAIDAVPALFAGQLAGDGSLLDGDAQVDCGLAPGIRITSPAREEQVRTAISASGGGVVDVDPEAVGPAHDRLNQSGLDVGSTAAVAAVARTKLAEDSRLPSGRDTIVVLTGRGRGR